MSRDRREDHTQEVVGSSPISSTRSQFLTVAYGEISRRLSSDPSHGKVGKGTRRASPMTCAYGPSFRHSFSSSPATCRSASFR